MGTRRQGQQPIELTDERWPLWKYVVVGALTGTVIAPWTMVLYYALCG